MKDILQGLSWEDLLKSGLIGGLFGWNMIEGAIFENEYPASFIKLYPIAAWRMVLLFALIAGARWSPVTGIMLAFTTFFLRNGYGNHNGSMGTTTEIPKTCLDEPPSSTGSC